MGIDKHKYISGRVELRSLVRPSWVAYQLKKV